VSGFHEHTVVLALDLGKAVTYRIDEVVIRRQDSSVQAEFDDCLRLGDGCDLAFKIRVAQFLLRNVCRILHDLVRSAVQSQ